MSRETVQHELSEGPQWTLAMAEASRFCLRLIGGVVSLALLWIVFSWLVVPAAIESAYRGESLPFLNSIISGQAIHPVEDYLASWETIRWPVLGMLIVLGLIPMPLLATRPELQIYLEGRCESTLALKPAVTNTILALSALALVFYLYYLHPVGFVYFIAEDQWAEYGSFVGWGMAACFLTWTLFKDRGARKPGFVLLTLAAFFVAMEEISWGQRILDLPSPKVFAQYNLQGETNLHNLVYFPYYIVGIAVFLWSIILPLLTTKWIQLRNWCDKLGIPIVPMYLWPFFLLAIIFFIFYPIPKSAELGELFLGIAVATLLLDCVLNYRGSAKTQGVPGNAATTGIIFVLAICTALLVHFYSDAKLLRYDLNWFGATSYPSAGMYGQSETVFEYIGQHPEFMTMETHFRYGVMLMQARQPTKAKKVLELSLAEQGRLKQKWPESPGAYRVAGQVLTVLGRKGEAKGEFMKAISKERARLQRAIDPAAEGRVRLSLAKTLLASGDSAAALEESSRARAAVSDRRSQLVIDSWIHENLPK